MAEDEVNPQYQDQLAEAVILLQAYCPGIGEVQQFLSRYRKNRPRCSTFPCKRTAIGYVHVEDRKQYHCRVHIRRYKESLWHQFDPGIMRVPTEILGRYVHLGGNRIAYI